jgi:peptidoglycan/LPS O-acetylase OafA/YrhL
VAYRKDIDGLRAVAVLLVIGFHAFPNYFPGGFVGVDIFFVVSGFLISGLIFSAQQNDSFSFADFYARRIRRIFPSLGIVLAACAIFGWYILTPAEYALLGKGIAASAAFINNFVLLQEHDYFNATAELNPLLHLWSLGIEEQFYLVWPVLMVLAWRKKGGSLAAAKIIFLLSFGLNIVLTMTDRPAAFYLPVTRFWELMLGCILAIGSFKHLVPSLPGAANRVEEVASWIGLALVVLAVLLINSRVAFPGWWALLPTFGAALLIFAGGNVWLNHRVLGSPLLVYIGLISYPLYLWHWPILTFVRLFRVKEPTALMKGSCIVLAFILADLTYRFVEKPLRFGPTARSLKTAYSAAALAVIAIVGLALNRVDGLPLRFPVETQNMFRDYSIEARSAARARGCFLNPDNLSSQFDRCDQHGRPEEKKIVVWGDSHAAHLVPGLDNLAKSLHFNLIQYTVSSCPPLFSFETAAHQKKCSDAYDIVAEKIAALRPHSVIMAASWFQYYMPSDGGRIDESIRATVERLKSMGVQRIVGVGQFPHWTASPQRILGRIYSPFAGLLNSVPQQVHDNKSLVVWGAFDVERRLEAAFLGAGATFISPKATLCYDNGCHLLVPGSDGAPVGWDRNHLTVPASVHFIRANERAILEE